MKESQAQVKVQPIDYLKNMATADDRDEAMDHADDPNAGNPDVDAGDDNPDQRPFTDNKAGG